MELSDLNESLPGHPIAAVGGQILYSEDYFYFPNPAPKASADLTVSNYKPNLTIFG